LQSLVDLTYVERRRCSKEAKTRNPLKFAGVPQLANRFQPLMKRSSSPYCDDSLSNLCGGVQIAIFWRNFCLLYFQRAACSIIQSWMINSHYGHIMCGSMVDIQSPTAESRRGKKERKEERKKEQVRQHACKTQITPYGLKQRRRHQFRMFMPGWPSPTTSWK